MLRTLGVALCLCLVAAASAENRDALRESLKDADLRTARATLFTSLAWTEIDRLRDAYLAGLLRGGRTHAKALEIVLSIPARAALGGADMLPEPERRILRAVLDYRDALVAQHGFQPSEADLDAASRYAVFESMTRARLDLERSALAIELRRRGEPEPRTLRFPWKSDTLALEATVLPLLSRRELGADCAVRHHGPSLPFEIRCGSARVRGDCSANDNVYRAAVLGLGGTDEAEEWTIAAWCDNQHRPCCGGS